MVEHRVLYGLYLKLLIMGFSTASLSVPCSGPIQYDLTTKAPFQWKRWNFFMSQSWRLSSSLDLHKSNQVQVITGGVGKHLHSLQDPRTNTIVLLYSEKLSFLFGRRRPDKLIAVSKQHALDTAWNEYNLPSRVCHCAQSLHGVLTSLTTSHTKELNHVSTHKIK